MIRIGICYENIETLNYLKEKVIEYCKIYLKYNEFQVIAVDKDIDLLKACAEYGEINILLLDSKLIQFYELNIIEVIQKYNVIIKIIILTEFDLEYNLDIHKGCEVLGIKEIEYHFENIFNFDMVNTKM